jgi:Uma2 family endonuclease
MADMMTVDEFYEHPERDDVILELRLGTLFEVPRPKPWHVNLQEHIAQLLRERCGPGWRVRIEMPFRALPQYEVRAADI